MKFGVRPVDAELVVKHALATGVRFAVSFHIGSQAPSVEPYREALQGTLDLIGHIDETLGGPTLIIDAIAAVVDDVLGARRDEFTRRPSPTVSSPPPL